MHIIYCCDDLIVHEKIGMFAGQSADIDFPLIWPANWFDEA